MKTKNGVVLTAFMLASVSAYASTFDPDTSILTVDSIAVGGTTYSNVSTVLTPAQIAAASYDTSGRVTTTTNTYDPATGIANLYFVQNLKSIGVSYANVKINLNGNSFKVGCATPQAVGAPNDPLFGDQWHLRNTGQRGYDGVAGMPGADLNLSSDPAWSQGQGISTVWSQTTGCGIQIAIVDDGLDYAHEDLNVNVQKSIDMAKGTAFDTNGTGISALPLKKGEAVAGSHGTAVAGLAAAKGNNGIGVAGVAYNAGLVGYNYLANQEDANLLASAFNILAGNHIYNNSWGAAQNGFLASSPAGWQNAIDSSNQSERSGLGAVHLFAGGNSNGENGRADYDGYGNYQGVLTIAALNDQGDRASYSNMGSNLLASAFGGEYCNTHTMTTTDIAGARGYNSESQNAGVYDYANNLNYTKCMNGTSAATPEAAGVVALMLEANSALSWRDVRWILATTARKTDPNNADWMKNGAGYPVNHSYGYGLIDTAAAIQKTKTWTAAFMLPKQKAITQNVAPNSPIADASAGGCGAINTSTINLANTGINHIEFVDVTPVSGHTEFGDLDITLNSPANSYNPTGTPSAFAVAHTCKQYNSATERYDDIPCGAQLAEGFRFGSARLMGEKADGNWILSVRDCKVGNTGTLQSWSLTVYGY